MKEIISIHIGQAGVQIGNSFWELLCLEHEIQKDGKIHSDRKSKKDEAFHTFLLESQENMFVPRSLFVDLESSVIDEVRQGQYSELFSKNQLISGKDSASNNFARGMYTVGKDIIDQCTDTIRKMVESCESLQGFFIFHSVGGGTGSGFASLLLDRIAVDHKKKQKMAITIYPSTQASSGIVESYNAVLSASLMIENLDVCVLMDNEALYNICKNNADIEKPTYTNLNKVIAQASASMTSSIRYNGTLNTNLNDITMNLVPYPRIHFMFCSCSSILPSDQSYQHSFSTTNITNQVLDPINIMLKCDPKHGKYLACSMLYRGDNSSKEIIVALSNIKYKKTIEFFDWVPTGFKVGINYQYPYAISGDQFIKINRNACAISNSSAIAEVFAKIDNKFDLIYTKRAFVHWYVGEGMEESEFANARQELEFLEKDYEEPVVSRADGEEQYQGGRWD